MLDLSALTALRWVETDGLGRLDFGCTVLAPCDFDKHASSLFGLVAGIDPSAPASGRAATNADLENLQIITCLTVRKARKPGEEASDLRFVLAELDEDTENGKLWVKRLPMEDLCHIAGAAMVRYAEAAARAARFRRGSKASADARRDREAVQPEPSAVPAGAELGSD
jgi:hypothetical protein